MNKLEKYQKQQRENASPIKVETELAELDSNFRQELETNPEYSLEVDPTNKYSMSEAQKLFIKYYTEYINIPLAASLAGIDKDTAANMFTMQSTEDEVRRINRARYLRRFNHKLLTIEQIGGWLSSLITDENVPQGDRLKTKDKLSVASMLISLNDMRRNAYDNPDIVMSQNIEEQLKSISVDTIKQLIVTTNINNDEDKLKVLEQLKEKRTLSPEEVAYLKTLSIDELLKILDISTKEKEEKKDE